MIRLPLTKNKKCCLNLLYPLQNCLIIKFVLAVKAPGLGDASLDATGSLAGKHLEHQLYMIFCALLTCAQILSPCLHWGQSIHALIDCKAKISTMAHKLAKQLGLYKKIYDSVKSIRSVRVMLSKIFWKHIPHFVFTQMLNLQQKL